MVDQDSMISSAVSEKARIWSRGFFGVFIGAVLVGAGLDLYMLYQTAGNNSPDFVTQYRIIEYVFLLAAGVVVVICLVGSSFTASKLVRVGFCLQAGASASAIVLDLVELSYLNPPAHSDPIVFSQLFTHLRFMNNGLYVLSLLCFSYGMARWKPLADSWLTLAQIALSIIGINLWIRHGSPLSNTTFLQTMLAVEGVAALWCGFFALALLLLRPAFWRRFPLITALLAAELLVGALLNLVPSWQQMLLSRLSFGQYEGLSFGLSWLATLGFLLLAQTERARKKAQRSASEAIEEIVSEPIA